MRFINPIVFVSDISVSTAFYRDVLGLAVETTEDVIVFFAGNFVIHDAAALTNTVWGAQSRLDGHPHGTRNLLLYFEDDDIEACFERVQGGAEMIHPIVKQAWGQSVFRFYDPDHHAIEVGEPQSKVAHA